MACFRAWKLAGASPGQLAFLVWLLATPLLTAQSAIVLQDVRFSSLREVTRVVLETSEEVQFAHSRLRSPERVVVDLTGTRPKREFRGLAYSVPVGDSRLKQIRVALNTRGLTRVVLDLETSDIVYALSRLTAPDRVIIELRQPQTATPPAEPDVTDKRTRPFTPPSRPSLPPPPAPLVAELESVPALAGITPRVPLTPSPTITSEPRLPAPPNSPVAAPSSPLPSVSASSPAPPPATPPPAPRTPPAAEPPAMEPAPAQRDRTGNRSLARLLGLKLNRIVIDPGHGGHDHGTTSKGGVVEKELVLDVAKRLGTMLEEQLGAEVIFTRHDDTYVSLERRTQIANQHRADLFLSIHANSSPYPAIAGAETYYLSLSAPREDLETVARENAGAQRSIGELNEVIRKIALADKVDESREFAARIQTAMHEMATRVHGRPLRNRGVKKAPFVVLIGAEMPSVLTEIGFLTNSREESLMSKADHRQKVADALFKGIVEYGRSLSHFRVARRAGD